MLLEEAAPADDPDADAVVLAACVDVAEASPGNCNGISGSEDVDAALPLVAPLLEPLVPAPRLEPCVDDGKVDVGILRGSVATVPLLELA